MVSLFSLHAGDTGCISHMGKLSTVRELMNNYIQNRMRMIVAMLEKRLKSENQSSCA
jgi:hypothetical protein